MSERHKEMPDDDWRDVTPLFLLEVKAKLADNARHNLERGGLKRGMPGHRIATHADLADEIDVDPNSIKHLLGGVRKGTKAKPPERSRLIIPISKALDIPLRTKLEIQEDRKRHHELLGRLTKEQLAEFLEKFGG